VLVGILYILHYVNINKINKWFDELETVEKNIEASAKEFSETVRKTYSDVNSINENLKKMAGTLNRNFESLEKLGNNIWTKLGLINTDVMKSKLPTGLKWTPETVKEFNEFDFNNLKIGVRISQKVECETCEHEKKSIKECINLKCMNFSNWTPKQSPVGRWEERDEPDKSYNLKTYHKSK
jgi:hypothetical protein